MWNIVFYVILFDDFGFGFIICVYLGISCIWYLKVKDWMIDVIVLRWEDVMVNFWNGVVVVMVVLNW